MRFALKLTGALAAGLILASIPATASETRGSEWTTPGWYVVEYQSGVSRDVIRAGPFRDGLDCAAFRQREFPMALRGHPEMDNLDCRQLLSRPGA